MESIHPSINDVFDRSISLLDGHLTIHHIEMFKSYLFSLQDPQRFQPYMNIADKILDRLTDKNELFVLLESATAYVKEVFTINPTDPLESALHLLQEEIPRAVNQQFIRGTMQPEAIE